MSERIHLFANGTHAADWMAGNCDRCALSGDIGAAGSSHCELFEAIADAGADDGAVAPEIAKRMGYTEIAYTWRCLEFTTIQPFAVRRERELQKLQAWTTGAPIRGGI